MYGLKAISEAHGWTITFLGITFVFTALTFLAIIMAHLNRIFDIIDGLKGFKLSARKTQKPDTSLAKPVSSHVHIAGREELSSGEHEIMRYFELITEKLGEPFSLEDVLKKAQDRGIPRPHSVLYTLFKKGIIVECEGDLRGFFCWRKGTDITVASKNTEHSLATQPEE